MLDTISHAQVRGSFTRLSLTYWFSFFFIFGGGFLPVFDKSQLSAGSQSWNSD